MLCSVVLFEVSSKAGSYLDISQGGAVHKEGSAGSNSQDPLVHHSVLHTTNP